jgi:hypothetical protein
MTAELAFSRSWQVGSRTCCLTMPRPSAGQARQAVIEWDPAPPSKLTAAEWVQYRKGRDAAFAELAEQMNLSVLVIG